jgi:hypothetical protein
LLHLSRASSSRRWTWRRTASFRRVAEAANGTGETKDALAQMVIALRDRSGSSVMQPVTGVLLAVHAGIPLTGGWLLLSIGPYL